jgi:hypothetical protein
MGEATSQRLLPDDVVVVAAALLARCTAGAGGAATAGAALNELPLKAAMKASKPSRGQFYAARGFLRRQNDADTWTMQHGRPAASIRGSHPHKVSGADPPMELVHDRFHWPNESTGTLTLTHNMCALRGLDMDPRGTNQTKR